LQEMVSARIKLDQINDGFVNMKKGGITRSVILFDH
jgi:Zn-dependent alcohol dehydrogenase